MAIVSILIPAYKPEYLSRALVSARQQTFADIEILVGDDTIDGALAPIVARQNDPRIRYYHHGFQNGLRNSHRLWERATGTYVKWLYDDDVLMPESVESLVSALEANPQSALAFHERVIIDENDEIVQTPAPLLNPGQRALVDRGTLVRNMIGQLHNFIGEPTNVMIRREGADMTRALDYRSMKLDFLCDVAMYLNLAERAPLVAVGGYLSAFRRHSSQQSDIRSANFSAGMYEWEIIVRAEGAAGQLTKAELAEAGRRLAVLYAGYPGGTNHHVELPEIKRLLANLPELVERDPSDLFSSPSFQANIEYARSAVAARIAQRSAAVASSAAAAAPKRAPATQNLCVVCEKPVDRWLPYPHPVDLEFLQQVESVGSTLERHSCPHCHSNDRDRHLWLYIAFTGILEQAPAMRILHIAPEPRIEDRIRRLAPLEYVAGDLHPRSPAHRKLNVEALEFPDSYFDLIICNHVLEHVNQPQAALAQFSRCLKQGGRLIAQTPYAPALKYTFELTKAPSEPFATRYFGQSDHVRLFGADIVEHFHAAGFSGELLPHASVLGDLDADVVGCNVREPFFLFTKSGAPRAAASPGHAAAADSIVVSPVTPTRSSAEVAAKPIRLVCATRHSQDSFLRETALGRSLAVMHQARAPELLLFDNNTTGLSALYNAAIEQAASNPAVLVFVHDDVSITDFFWTDRIQEGLRQFDVLGLAGNRRRSPHQPAWAFATPQFTWDTPEFLSGSVGHGKGLASDGVSYFGPAGVECKLLDGLMLIADSARLIESGVRFDEQFDFHFYDMDFCRQAELKGLKMGTWPISVVHESAGAFNTPPWRAAYERYLRKYGE
jgi:SAM-dependent methyltransferase/GT2 family glycosyltransferase